MRVYRERLGVPISWWLATLAGVLVLGTMLWTVLPMPLGIASYAVLVVASAALLYSWGAVNVEITDAALRAGSQVLQLAAIGEVAAMDVAQTRALRGPQANPAAYLLVRPYLPESVYVEVAGRPRQRPYWLIGTRNPAGLAAAIEDARHASHDCTWDDAGGEREDLRERAKGEPSASEPASPSREARRRRTGLRSGVCDAGGLGGAEWRPQRAPGGEREGEHAW